MPHCTSGPFLCTQRQELIGHNKGDHALVACIDWLKYRLPVRVAENRSSAHTCPTLRSGDSGTNRTPSLMHGTTVRRITPTEAEFLQGFSRNYTMIPWGKKPREECPDGPRYKALGNSMAVPVVSWIGQRIQMVEDLCSNVSVAEK
jgi:site-specific DNA-cytosine methylase